MNDKKLVDRFEYRCVIVKYLYIDNLWHNEIL